MLKKLGIACGLIGFLWFGCCYAMASWIRPAYEFENALICPMERSEAENSALATTLSEFMQIQDTAFHYELISDFFAKSEGVTKREYILYSQKWPINAEVEIKTTLWSHRMTIYKPKEIKHSKVLLFVSGGNNVDKSGRSRFSTSAEYIDFSKTASETNAVAIVLENVPNQYLFINGQPKKEDQILAYTYRKVMDAPLKNRMLAGHLPMAKAIVKAMDAVQEILSKEDNIDVNEFLLSGMSKRGWAVWLASLADDRVSAIIPIVIDVLNVQSNIRHICNSYKTGCPEALRDYKELFIIRDIDTTQFSDLMTIEDPMSYDSPHHGSQYAERLSIPKYIICASGDDFFVPDSSKFYFSSLRGGSNHIRYLPNAMHYLGGNAISNALGNMKKVAAAINNYFYFHLHSIDLPKIEWEFTDDELNIRTETKPERVTLYTASNHNSRDFRCLQSYSTPHLFWKKLWSTLSSNLCDMPYRSVDIQQMDWGESGCNINISLPKNHQGWRASFAELEYDIAGKSFITTTQVTIHPDEY